MAGPLASWKIKYGLGLETTWGTGVVSGDDIPNGGPKMIAPTNVPDFNPNIDFIESDKIHGNAGKIYSGTDAFTELQVGVKNAQTSIDIDLDPVTISPFLMSLCQRWSDAPASDNVVQNTADPVEADTNFTPNLTKVTLTSPSNMSKYDFVFGAGFVNQPPALFSKLNGFHRIMAINNDNNTITVDVEWDDLGTVVSETFTNSESFSSIIATNGKQFLNYNASTNIDFASKDAGTPTNPPILLSLIKDTAEDGNSYRLISSIVNSISISGARGEPIRSTIEVMAKDVETDFAGQGQDAYSLPIANNAPLLFQDAIFRVGPPKGSVTGGTTAAELKLEDLISFDMTLSNNLEAQHYDSQTLSNAILGRFTVEGSFVLPWRDNTKIGWFVNNAEREFLIYWGTPGSDPFFAISGVAIFKNNSVAGDAEQETTLNFESVNYNDGTDELPGIDSSIKILVGDGVSY